MMPRIFVHEAIAPGQTLTVTGEDGHHLTRVLRLRDGDNVAVAFDGRAYVGEVERLDPKAGQLDVRIGNALSSHDPSIRVYLVQAMAKGEKIDFIIQKATEIGAAGFVLFESMRSVARVAADKAASKVSRWNRVAQESAAQAQRDRVPSVVHASTRTELARWMTELRPGLVVFLDEREAARGLKSALQAYAAAHREDPVVLLIGPEGGWDDTERTDWMTTWQAVPVTLGRRILRTETAGAAALAAVLYEFGEFGG